MAVSYGPQGRRDGQARVSIWLLLGALVGWLMALPALGAPPLTKAKPAATKATAPVVSAPKGNALAGAEKSDAERCQECHGTHGQGSAEGRFARLAGQSPQYIIRQVEAFRSGARKNDIMGIMARSVTDEDLLDIAAYFASQKPIAGHGGGQTPAAKALYTSGDPARGIVACAACHGEGGKGSDAGPVIYPLIAGQEFHYVEKQLLDWRNGLRADSPDGVMVRIAKSLTEAEITAMAHYLAGQP